MRFGYFLSCEEYSPAGLVEQARLAEEAGFDELFISDHYHPWLDAQGQSPFVWSVVGALSQVTSLPVTTAVTCPTQRITGEGWPRADLRLEMLEEAIGIIRELWTGEVTSHEGDFYTVDTAQIYTLPEETPQIHMSAFGPKALEVAGRIADGFISTKPDAESLVKFRELKGRRAPAASGYKVAYAKDRDEAIDHAHRLWPTVGIPGELAQVLPSPQHFEQASQLVTREMTAQSTAFGADATEHVAACQPFVEAGFDTVYVANMGPHYAEMIRFYGSDVLPALRGE
jgi:G6PDH family F420-dependent oxidoreductase